MTTSWPDRIVEAGALFLLVFTPLAFGTYQPWSEAIAGLVVLGMAVTYLIGTVLRDWELRIELPPGWLPALLLLALVVAQAVVPAWSLDPHATRRMALKLLTVAAFFLICWNVYRTPAQARRALWTMIGMGTLLAVLGIVQRATWNGHLYWVGPEALGSAFGPFVNRAHFAGLMVTIVPMALALSSQRQQRRRRPSWHRTWRARLREWNSREESPRGLVFFLVLVMGGAALVSGSRGGLIALLATLCAMVLGALAGGRSWAGRAGRLAVAAVLVVLAGAWISSEILHGTIGRLAEELDRPETSARLRIWSDALALWGSAPVLGTGLGTFGVAFPRFRTLEAPVAFTHAESDWVQLLTDTGLLGLGLALALVASVGLALADAHADAGDRRGRLLALAGLVALGGAVVQGVGNYTMLVTAGFFYLAGALVLAGRSK